MVQDQIRYDVLVQDALREVIRKVLLETSKAGPPGDHHFFITFLTNAPEVQISTRLKERYPDQMTIVLQHQFKDLSVSETSFEVTLFFGEISERLIIPFSSIQVFYDPVAAFEAAFDLPSPSVLEENVTISHTPTTLSSEQTQDKLSAKEKNHTEKNSSNSTTKQSADIVSLDSFRKK
ncbi:SspB family protein [Bartonella ancashensis]|uniref:Stringent starvation protein B n=1 Tax=Bartonella ancashensis TaxID=1318743 RepID=A0A0M4L885_9HYPH|nr:ClpXP protease specificity-enhancing factor SspB [Bartonella ancashensis]ALE03638.1 hypothetical protein PU02_0824 [Bartonella ancashensis]